MNAANRAVSVPDNCVSPDFARALENSKARYLGKSGSLTDLLKSLGKLPAG